MGVPGFYSWLTKRYPLIKHMVGKETLPEIDYLYLDMNGIIYKCVKDDSVIFKSQIMPKEFEQIWIEVFNYINMIVNLLKPTKMVYLALDGVAPRSKMNNQRSRRFKSARDYKQFIEKFYGYQEEQLDSQENFKNNSISPGTKFMEELNQMIGFFIQKKIQEDDYWKNISIVFTGSTCPGEGQHKIMQWIRSNKQKFQQNDNHCLYGADADLIMLGLTLPMKNICIIREEYIHSGDKVKIKDSKKQKVVQFEMIFLTILKEYFDIQYKQIKEKMKNLEYSVTKIIRDFVLLFFFIGNDFLPRCMAYNIRQKSIEKLIVAFKNFLCTAEDYVVAEKGINLRQLSRLVRQVAKYQVVFIEQKAEDAEKFLEKKVQFQDQFTAAMKEKVMKDSQFLKQLKNFYMNNGDTGARTNFYKQKFGIDPTENINQFYQLLGNYLHGIKFVHQYYFENLSSWSWYYPYYYAPFLSDVSFYLDYLVESGTDLKPLQLGAPFQPFKQLMCILPKESVQLLPANFQNYLKDKENSPLRTPIDFYPDTFQDDLYGSIRSFEAVSLIPFLDQTIIQRVYEQGIKGITQSEKQRNTFKKTRVFEYVDDSDDKEQNKKYLKFVKSPLNPIESFQCNIDIREFDLLKPMHWKTEKKQSNSRQTATNLDNQENEIESHLVKNPNLKRMPTLHMHEFDSVLFDDGKRSIRYQLQILESTQNEEGGQFVDKEKKKAQKFKLSNVVYYGYPLEHSGRIQAILTKQYLQKNPDFDPINYDLDLISKDYAQNWMLEKRTKQLFFDLIDRQKRKCNYLDLSKTQTLIFVKDTQYFSRRLDGSFGRVYEKQNQSKTFQIVPMGLVSREKKYSTTKNDFRFNSIQQQFPLHSQVMLTHPNQKLCGSKGIVVGYSQQNSNNTKIKVKVTKPIKRVKKDKLFKIVNTDEVFLDLRFVSEIIGFKHDIILTILDTVSIELPRQKNLPESIDIGLNFISRQDNKLVPNLVRLNFENKSVAGQDSNRRFKFLELSVKAFQILLEFKKKYSSVLNFIKHRHYKLIDQAKKNQKPINWRQKMKASDIFIDLDHDKKENNPEHITKQLMKVYLWLIKNKQTHMPMSSIYSKQISYKKISKLEEYFKSDFKKTEKDPHPKQIQVDPNFVFSLQLAQKGFPYLAKRPDDHTIGDQIVCLHPQHFGHFGVVVGVDDDRYQVIFSKPSFGKNDLNGLCTNLWGGKFRFKDLMNLDTWLPYFRQRCSPKSILQNSGWIDSMKGFLPKFKTKPIKNFNDFQLFIKNKQLVKVFDPSSIEHILQVKKNLKQIQLDDKDYQIVDNYQQDYKYKYDKNETTVNEKEVQLLGKNKKWMEKKGLDYEGKNQDFEKEIIENKMDKLTLNQQTEKDKDEQDEGEEAKFIQDDMNRVQKLKQKPMPAQKAKKAKYQQKKPQYKQNTSKTEYKQKQQQKVVEPTKVEAEAVQIGQEQDATDIMG